ncbi:MAG: hypothetical protein ACREIA_17775, partial [Opitutaceae bacterium]
MTLTNSSAGLQLRHLAASASMFSLFSSAAAQDLQYDQHVIFDNAPAGGGYYHSDIHLVAPSTLE